MTQKPSRSVRSGPSALPPPRIVIEHVKPQVDGGRFPIKRIVGEPVLVTADIHADGHDQLAAVLRFRPERRVEWAEQPMRPLVNDVWEGSFVVTSLEPWVYTIDAWVDAFRTWRHGLSRKVEAGRAERVDLLGGAELVAQASQRASGEDAIRLRDWTERLKADGAPFTAGLDEELAALMAQHPDRRHAATFDRALRVQVDRERARFSTWYEMFPRSCSAEPGRHGTWRDCEARLAYVAEMGFDVLYLPPIHPIGRRHRKGRNNTPAVGPDDVGSPWAIGAREGGHKAIHPDLGSLEDFRRFVARAGELGIEVALDYALQCAPDHPYVEAHPGWFRWRPDGTVQYAENPPKKYEDIYPIHFEHDDWKALWDELKSILLFWIAQGIRIFRVDNPHTKPFGFWQWVIAEVRRDHPDVLFLSEAFTRPKVMYHLAKLGFAQSYTYFAWRNTGHELTEYFTELTKTEVKEYFRPNLWPNTPDILTEPLQFGGRPAFMARVTLAATLGASYGIYGPAFELLQHEPRQPGTEEYLNSEKYEVRHWDLDHPASLRGYLARLNRIRRENPALQSDGSLRFHHTDNDQILAYSKSTPDLSNVVVTVVNLDPHHVQSGWVDLPIDELGLPADGPYQAHDLLTDAHYFWTGRTNFVLLDPAGVPAHVLRLRRRVRTERDFDYFL